VASNSSKLGLRIIFIIKRFGLNDKLKNPHHRYEMPIIDKYYRKLKKEGFLVLAVNVKQSAEVALAFIV
jgi:hypothetical protein